jgi:nucleotide-binding universal stress UspA family protein
LNGLDFLLPVAIDQAKVTGAMIWLLHVIPPDAYVSTESGAFPFTKREKAFRDAEAALAKVADQLKAKNLACAYEVRRWYPVDQITAFIRERGIKRLIIGTSGRGKLGKLLLGSVAEELIRSLDIPVCTVGPHFKPTPSSNPRRVIFATSLRHDAEKSVQFAVELAAGMAAELTVLYVLEADILHDGTYAEAMSTIDEMLKRAQQKNLLSRIRIRYGEPAEEIVSECSALGPELLILGAVPTSPVTTHFRAGVVYRVIAQAPCPTFTLRTGAKAKQSQNGCASCVAQNVS